MAGETTSGTRNELKHGADVRSGRRSKPATGALPEYLPASWKGVPFFVLTTQDDFGRRGDLYEYPLQENTGYVDLGRKARRFKVEGYLIGPDQIALTKDMRLAIESPQPGVLVHPMYGPQTVACVTGSCAADYRKDKKRTRVNFDFVEAITLADQGEPPKITPAAVWEIGKQVRTLHKDRVQGEWSNLRAGRRVPGQPVRGLWANQWRRYEGYVQTAHRDLARKIKPARDERSWDAVDALESLDWADTVPFLDFGAVADPIDNGTATVRRLWSSQQAGISTDDTALSRLRLFNGTIVKIENESGDRTTIQSLVETSRLSLIRDFATAAVMKRYTTKNAAFADLDFIMRVYDDEERAAAAQCWDDVVAAIRAARAACASAMLATNIKLPGVFTSQVDGVWPSLVVAHKLYADGKRHEEVEDYNTHMPPFFIGREAVAPAR